MTIKRCKIVISLQNGSNYLLIQNDFLYKFSLSLNDEYSAELSIDSTSALYANSISSKKKFHTYKLYPYVINDLIAVFVYGTDYQRQHDIFLVPNSVLLVTSLIVLFMSLSSITLYIARRRFNLPHDSFTLSVMDCLIPFIGGGNLRMEHRFERWFFGVMLFGAFFIISVFGGDLVDTVVQIHSSKIETFDDLAKTNVKSYTFSDDLTLDQIYIAELLK